MTKRKKLHFEVVKEYNGQFAVKTQKCKNGRWYTAADTFAVGNMNAKEMAEFITNALNKKEEEIHNNII